MGVQEDASAPPRFLELDSQWFDKSMANGMAVLVAALTVIAVYFCLEYRRPKTCQRWYSSDFAGMIPLMLAPHL